MSWLKNLVERSDALLKVKFSLLIYMHYWDYWFRHNESEKRLVSSAGTAFRDCPDWCSLPKVPNAGQLVGQNLIMHNGIKVLPTAYNGYSHYRLIAGALGVHEPQEELLFANVLPHVKPGSAIIELGSFWSFYSIWFLQEVQDSTAYCVEPELSHLNYGRENMRRNKKSAHFTQAYVDQKEADGVLPTIAVDSFVQKNKINAPIMLHADIQGFEFKMLQGAHAAFDRGQIEWVFISTHSDELHEQCREFLLEKNFVIFGDVPIADCWNPDGILAGYSSKLNVPSIPAPSLKRQVLSGRA